MFTRQWRVPITFSSNSAVIELLAAEVYAAAKNHARMKRVSGEKCISRCKAQSMEYRHKTSPSPRKFKIVASAGKVLFTVFCEVEGVVHMEFLEQGQTVNSERYISILSSQTQTQTCSM
ncbi:histone-lysine N-methyltransferase SETMAR [Elysia marginata]|uniref:Histone-lysine N-methyltransferase SETMAR n=1 Tax=Elysia marginata TaxID=1093978 RepID=A0AAV4I0I1_9GAST|nr:histone-lysine N-methyltransferase SETMAR [Elysia marginata]